MGARLPRNTRQPPRSAATGRAPSSTTRRTACCWISRRGNSRITEPGHGGQARQHRHRHPRRGGPGGGEGGQHRATRRQRHRQHQSEGHQGPQPVQAGRSPERCPSGPQRRAEAALLPAADRGHALGQRSLGQDRDDHRDRRQRQHAQRDRHDHRGIGVEGAAATSAAVVGEVGVEARTRPSRPAPRRATAAGCATRSGRRLRSACRTPPRQPMGCPRRVRPMFSFIAIGGC